MTTLSILKICNTVGLIALGLGIALTATQTGCSAPKGTLFYGALSKGQPVVVVASGAAAGAQAVVAYDASGSLLEVLIDTTYQALIPKGLARMDPFHFVVALDGASDLLGLGSTTGGYSDFAVNSNFNGVLYQMAFQEKTGNYWAIKGNFIEAFDKNGNRIGSGVNPAIATTVGACVLSTPKGVAIDQVNNRLIVTNTGTGYVNVYDISTPSSVTCFSRNVSLGAANVPVPILAHSSGLIFSATQLATATKLWAMNLDGSGSATAVYTDAARTVMNNPTAMIELPDGTLLMANSGTAQIDRFSVSGTAASTRVGSTPFIKDAFTPYVNDMIVIKGL